MSPPSRASEVDIVRGFALLGICVVNMPYLGQPLADLLTPSDAMHDRAAQFVVSAFFEGKFFPLFSFLFGWGVAVQMERGGPDFLPRYLRRLAGLLLIGVAHAVLVFIGDILILYAGLGLLILPLRHWPAARLMALAAGLAALGAVTLAMLAVGLSAVTPPPTIGAGYLGGFGDAVRQRLEEWPLGFAFVLLFNGPLTMAAFCVGLAAAKTGFLQPGSAVFAAWHRRLPWLLGIGLPLNLLYAASVLGWLGEGLLAVAAFAGLAVAGPCLAAAYLILIVQAARAGRLGAGMGAAGRMSLTAYVAEGVLAGLIFNGYGLGLHGQFDQAGLFGIAVLVYLAVHVLCAAWLRFARQGPLEALLRAITGGRASAAPSAPGPGRGGAAAARPDHPAGG
jgi:uncharacterized protein